MGNGSGSNGISSIAAPLTAGIGVFAALAVTGVLGQAQRNHGLWLILALCVVLVGALLWLIAALIKGRAADKEWVFALKLAGVIVAALGLAGGIVAIWRTQTDSERPGVSSTFNPTTGVLEVTATAHGVRTDSRLIVTVSGFSGTPDDPVPKANPPTLYYAVVGPSGDGDITHTASVPIPQKYTLVGVKAWTGTEPTACTTREIGNPDTTPQHARVGCFLLQIRG